MKKTLGRLGALAAAVGLVTAGLVGLAGPAQAGEINESDFVGLGLCGAGEQASSDDEFEKYNLESSFGPVCNRKGLTYVGYTRQKGSQFLVYTPYGCPVGQTCQSVNAGDEPGESEPVQKTPPLPPPCWDASVNNCPVGGAHQTLPGQPMICRYWTKQQTHWGHGSRPRLHPLMFRTTENCRPPTLTAFDHHTPAAMRGPWPSEPLTTGNGSTGT